MACEVSSVGGIHGIETKVSYQREMFIFNLYVRGSFRVACACFTVAVAAVVAVATAVVHQPSTLAFYTADTIAYRAYFASVMN